MGMPFVNPPKLLAQISSWGKAGQSILVLAGGVDKIMTLPIMESLANTYRKAYTTLAGQRRLESEDGDVQPIPGDGGRDTAGQGVRYCVAPGAGHHLQNDVSWEVGANKLLEFYEQL